MTSATPAPDACGAMVTTVQLAMNTRVMLYTMLNSHATPMLVCCSRYLHAQTEQTWIHASHS